VIGSLITRIARPFGADINPENRVSGSERLKLGAFELMKFFKVERGRIGWIDPEDRLIPLLSVE